MRGEGLGGGGLREPEGELRLGAATGGGDL